MKTNIRIWIVALMLGLLLPHQAEAFSILLDIDLDDDPSTINGYTTAESATIRVVLQPTEPNEIITEFSFYIGSHCYVVGPGYSMMVADFDFLDWSMDEIPGLVGEYWYIPGGPCLGYESDSPYLYCDVFATEGTFLLAEPIFLDTFHVDLVEEWYSYTDIVPIHGGIEIIPSSIITSTLWMGMDWAESPGPWTGDEGISRGIAWADFSLDTYPDLYIARFGSGNRLYQNMGDGSFVDVTSGPTGDAGLGLGAFWADANGSGSHDLYLVNDGANVLLRHLGWTTLFEDVTTDWLGGSENTQGMAWSDYDLDGLPDLYISNFGAPNLLLHNQGDMNFIHATPYEMSAIGNSRGVAWGDYDNDGDPDLYVTTTGEGNHLFRNEGGGNFVEVTIGGLPVSSDCRGCAWGDFDRDEDLDLYVTRHDGENLLLRNDGGDLFTDVTGEDPGGELGDSGPGLSIAWVDYDNDRRLDLYVVNDGQPNVLLRNLSASNASFKDVTQPLIDSSGPGGGAAWADVDMDGDLDVFLVAEGQPDQLIRNEGNSQNHWLHVDPQNGHDDVLTPSSVIGARVRVVAGGVAQIREVSGGEGYLAQNSLVVEFGLGSADVVDTLDVWFPDGGGYRAILIPADQLIMCNHVSGVPVEGSVPAFCRIFPCVPNPFNPHTSVSFTLSGTRRLTQTIHAVDGSCVRNFPAQEFEPGLHEIHWDGRDDRGRALASGVYIFRLKARDFEATQRMTLVR